MNQKRLNTGGLYDVHDKLQRTYSRFNDDAFSARFRRDAKLICAGDKSGSVRVFDTDSKAMLREMKHHTAAVRCTVWSCDGTNILSASDDKKVLRWDLATETMLWNSSAKGIGGHTDYVRALDASPQTSDLFVSAGYDHSVKLWDSRQQKAVMSMVAGTDSGLAGAVGLPVESVLFAQNGTMLISAAGSVVQIWDVLAGGRLLHTFNHHQKNVSGLCLDGSSGRLLSCGLDGLVKIYSLTDLSLVHGLRFPSPLLAVACPPDPGSSQQEGLELRKLAVAAVDGTVSVRGRLRGKSKGSVSRSDVDDELVVRDAEVDRFLHPERLAPTSSSSSSAVVVVHTPHTSATQPHQRLQPYEKLLKRFSYGKALDAGLKSRHPGVVVALLSELAVRGALGSALAGRDEAQLEPLLSFAAKHVADPKYARVIVQVMHRVLDLYAGVLGHSEVIDDLFCKLQRQIKAEVGFQRQAMRIMGSLDGIISVATMPKRELDGSDNSRRRVDAAV